MSYRVLDTLVAVRGDLAEALVPAEAWPALQVLARAAPDGVSQFGFEVRLAGAGGTVDLGLAIRREDEASLALAGRVSSALDAAVAGSEAWRRLRDFAEAWTEPGSLLSRWVPFLFLELDAASAAQAVPDPCVFVALDAPLAGPTLAGPGSGRATGADTTLEVSEEAARWLRGAPLSGPLRDRVLACFDALPEGAHVLHLGAMLGRSAAGVRLSVSIAQGELLAYLGKIGWAHAVGELAGGLARYEWSPGNVQVDFDVGHEIHPRLGLGVRPAGSQDWQELLDRLVADGRCRPERRDALLAWPGTRTERLAGYGFPCRLRRETSHVKLVVEPGRPLEVKAYFSASARPGFFG